MKYIAGNITVSVAGEYVKKFSRDEFIAQHGHYGLNEANLGKLWDLVNAEADKTPEVEMPYKVYEPELKLPEPPEDRTIEEGVVPKPRRNAKK